MLTRIVRGALPLGAAALGGALFFHDEISNVFPKIHAQSSEIDSEFNRKAFPRGSWNANWDFRDPMSLVNERKYAAANEEEKKRMIKEATPTATRTVVLVRHGQYDMKEEPHSLTALGREQAELLGGRLAAMHAATPFHKLTMSTMTRAAETAAIILKALPDSVQQRSDSLVEEGAPYPPEPPISNWKPHDYEFHEEGARIEAAFQKYIHRASPSQKENSVEVIVCHGNVIRYFICRALQFPPEGWLRMSLGNCSITRISINADGRVQMVAMGDVGFLPPGKITHN